MNKALESNDTLDFAAVVKTIFANVLHIEDLYTSSNFEHHCGSKLDKGCPLTHKEEFILKIVLTFLRIKAANVCKKNSLEEQHEERERRKMRINRILLGR